MPKVTVIIPVYNSEKYIEKCIESILNQTYKDFEILIVNDGSKDDSQKIIDKYKNKFPDKIIAIQQQNKGVSTTRNESVQKANGKYIMFIDNDDYIDKEYIETFVKNAEEGDYDIVLGGYRRITETNKILKTLELEDEEWSKLMVVAPWAKIYKKQYLIDNNITFLNTNIGEDVYFNLKAMLINNKTKIIKYIGYNWFFNTKSVSNTIQKNITQLEVYKLLNSIYDELNSCKVLEEKHEIVEAYFIRYIAWILSFSTKNLKYKTISDEYNKIFDWLKNRFPNYKKNKLISYTKPKGELFSIRFFTATFMIANKLHLGKVFVYLYSKI